MNTKRAIVCVLLLFGACNMFNGRPRDGMGQPGDDEDDEDDDDDDDEFSELPAFSAPTEEDGGVSMDGSSDGSLDGSAVADAGVTPMYGTQGHGQSCINHASCLQGHLCTRMSGYPGFACSKTCTTASECGAGTGGCCNVTVTDVTPITRTCNMQVTCDPLKNTGCAAGNGCYFVPCSGDTANVACSLPGKVELGQPCTYTVDCKPGHSCRDSVCRKLCRLGPTNNDGCSEGSCMAISISSAILSTQYGYCPVK